MKLVFYGLKELEEFNKFVGAAGSKKETVKAEPEKPKNGVGRPKGSKNNKKSKILMPALRPKKSKAGYRAMRWTATEDQLVKKETNVKNVSGSVRRLSRLMPYRTPGSIRARIHKKFPPVPLTR